MPELEINDIATKGVVRDEPAYMLPPEIWTQALNMHAKDDGMVRMGGWTQVFGIPGVAPHFAIPVVGVTSVFWLYTSLTKGYVYDGSSHTNITRQTAAVDVNYTAVNTRDWNGTIFGGIPVLNNNADVPQYWDAFDVSHKLKAVTNWPAATRAAVIRSLGAYMIGINLTKSSTRFPHTVKWSAETVEPGELPPSWDETDDTLDAGEYDLYDVNAGNLVEALPLAGKMYLYKEQSTWVMRFVGGRAVFGFDTLYETSGILAPRCVQVTGDGKNQIVATQDDLIVHNGGQPASILDKRLRREIFAAIDPANYLNSYIYIDPDNNEAVFAFPETGRTNPNRGVVFNYKTGCVTEMDGITYRNVATGRIQTASAELWSTGSDTWDDDTGPWDVQERRRTIACGTDDTLFFKLNDGILRNGASFIGTLQRTGLAVIGQKRTGEWINNFELEKMLDRMWPKVVNGTCQIRFGYTDMLNGTIVWSNFASFDPAVNIFAEADPPVSGRAVAIEFRCPGDFRLDGYRLNIVPLGNY